MVSKPSLYGVRTPWEFTDGPRVGYSMCRASVWDYIKYRLDRDRCDRPMDRSMDRSSSSSVDDDDDDDDASPERGVVARRRGDGGGATDATDAMDAMDAGRRGDDANERGHHG